MRNVCRISSTPFRWKLNFCIQAKGDSSKRYLLTFFLCNKTLNTPLSSTKKSAHLIKLEWRYSIFLSFPYLWPTRYSKYSFRSLIDGNIKLLFSRFNKKHLFVLEEIQSELYLKQSFVCCFDSNSLALHVWINLLYLLE
jgi:hypothetical protein